MISPAYLLRRRRRPIPPILLSRLHLSLPFHQYAPSKTRPKPSRGGAAPNLLLHKDWLSPPEVIRLFQSLKDPNSALPLLAQLSARRDYNPSESLYSAVIHKLALASDFDAVESLMQRIKIERKCRLSDAFFRQLIKLYGHSAGRINRAVETLISMPDYKCWPSITTFNTVLNLLVTTKQFEIIHDVYRRAPELGVEIDSCCLNIIIKGLCGKGEIGGALQVLDEFPQQKCLPTARTFSTIMHAMCSNGRVEEAFRLLDRMDRENVEADAVVFNVLIAGMRRRGRAGEGAGILETMAARGCDPNPGTYLEVVHCLVEAGRLGEARGMMERMTGKGMRPSYEAYKAAMEGFCGEGSVEDVEWALREMVGHGFVPKMGMWKRMVQCVVS